MGCGMDCVCALEEVAAVAQVVQAFTSRFLILIVVEGSRHVERQNGDINKDAHPNEEPRGLIHVDLCC